jgi:predicted O-methyltransferase YrrM
MSSKTFYMPDQVYDYFLSVGLRDQQILQELRQETAKLATAEMQISPEQGQFMSMLVKLIQAKYILEIGTFTGYSSLCMAMALPEDGSLIACDRNLEWTEIAKRYWEKAGVAHKIKLYQAPAIETLDRLLQEGFQDHFDFIFIDADKIAYDSYYEKALLLVKQYGLIGVDNVLKAGDWLASDSSNNMPGARAVRVLNQKIHQDSRVEMCMVPIGDGLTLVRKINPSHI